MVCPLPRKRARTGTCTAGRIRRTRVCREPMARDISGDSWQLQRLTRLGSRAEEQRVGGNSLLTRISDLAVVLLPIRSVVTP